MYSILHETDNATTVNLSTFGKLLPGKSKQLVTVCAKTLKVYRFNPYISHPDHSAEPNKILNPTKHDTNLECLLHFTFMAPPRSIKTARIPSCPDRDSILLTFEDAKLSIVNINPATMNLNTHSLHCIEDEFLRDGYTSDTQILDLAVDPDNRCCAFLIFGRHLAIVPFLDKTKSHLESYTVPLRGFEDRLDNVSDMTFLYGYYEPTILFLYQPIPTTAGRASIRYDTVSILGVSLNVKERTHAVVWNFGGLPMTIERCLAMPLPVSGICLFGINEIVYLNQSIPPCGISLNSNADEFSKFPLNNCRDLRITLDACAFQAISSSEIFVVLRTGSLFHLTLDIDPSNAVRGLVMRKVYETVSPHTMTLCFSRYIFIGSRLGDSVLLEYKSVHRNRHCLPDTSAEDDSQPPSKKPLILNEDDEFLYGFDETLASTGVDAMEEKINFEREFVFKVLDRLLNVGICRDMKCCKASNISPENFHDKDSYFDLVTASGHGKEGSICFFERSVRPDVFTSVLLDEARQFWTVGRNDDGTHKYLVVAKEKTTMAFELGAEMAETDDDIFIKNETTIAAGELFSDGISIQIQVTSMFIVLVGQNQQIETFPIDSNFPIQMASIVDPYIVLLTQNGKVLLYRITLTPHVQLIPIPEFEKFKHEKSPITSACLYKDTSGIIQLCSQSLESPYDEFGNIRTHSFSSAEEKAFRKKEKSLDDIDVLLYGDEAEEECEEMVASEHFVRGQKRIADEMKPIDLAIYDDSDELETETDLRNPDHIIPSYWLFFTRENGNLYVYTVPGFQLVYMVKKVNQLHEVLYDDLDSANEEDRYMNVSTIAIAPQASESKGSESVMIKPEEIIIELLICGMGQNRARPILSILVDDTVLFYEMFAHDNGIDGHIAIRFRKIQKNVVIREQRFVGPNGRAPLEVALENEKRFQYINYFDRMGTLTNGIFVAGNYPSIFFIGKDDVRLHPFIIDGPLNTIVPFNNVNCPHGLLYLKKEDNMTRIAMLNKDINYDASYPFKKINVGKTVHFIVYLLHRNIFVVITSEQKQNNKLCQIVNEDKQVDNLERDDKFMLPTLDFYSLKLFSTEDWSFIPTIEEKFDEFEVITCCEEVVLHSESTTSGLQSYIVVGTAVNYGDEVFVRGRIVIYEAIEVVAEEGLITTRHGLKTLYNKEQKGPVTSMCSCDGYLLTGMGQKVFIWQFKDNQLHGVSFLDLHFYVHKLIGFRNLALACDLHRSLCLIRYQEEFKALSLVSRDLRPMAPQPMTTHFVVDNKQLGFILTDEAANIILFSYLPETKESIGGERLIIRSGLNIGSLVNTIVRVKGHTAECYTDTQKSMAAVQTCMFFTLDGSVGIVRPLTEKIFRRLHMLQQLMSLQIPQSAGLNPRGARALRPPQTGTNQQLSSAKNIVDGLLLFQYLHLSTQDKADLAKRLGSSRYQIIDDLTELRKLITHF